jgi:hypothetical protein
MLELSALRLGPWQDSKIDLPVGFESFSGWRTVFDDNGSVSVGAVGCQEEARPWKWLSQPRSSLRMFEGDDLSLVSAAERSAGPNSLWHVLDADYRRVGGFRRARRTSEISCIDRFDRPLALVSWKNEGGQISAVGPQGSPWMQGERLKYGSRIQFTAQLSPFVRMVLLAAVITAGW